MIRKIAYAIAVTCCLCIGGTAMAQRDRGAPNPHPAKDAIDQKVNALLSRMTLAEKIGQMNQYNGDWAATGPVTNDVGNKLEDIRQGRVGAVLNIMGTEHVRTFQDAAMQSRLKIPLLFGQDVIHGYRITFPIPLAEASSWDLAAIERAERVAATEASASGINWTFAPMVDIARDPRWGRVMEGSGEDPYLGSLIAAARVRGFQGEGLGNTDAVMACAKHFAAYGAAIGGRDYNSVDMSLHMLWEIYLPPFRAAAAAGAATFMNSFNDLNGTPATASSYLQREILKGQWGFKGFVVSDWGSIGEMINHGYVRDGREAAEAAIKAGNDMDMESHSYIDHLAGLVADKKVPVSLIDESVRRILRKKFELGLFDDPYRFIDPVREKSRLNTPENIEAAREMARKSMVLLKNEGHLLPLPGYLGTIALIGPLAGAKKELKGFWSLDIDPNEDIPSILDGMRKESGNTRIVYVRGCGIDDTVRSGFDSAVAAARQADVVVMAMGEAPDMTGEAKSKSNIHLPGVQAELIKAVQGTGKPVVVVMLAGRPMVFDWTAEHIPAILYGWWPGSQGGNAIADVLYGKYDPAGKLPISFPRSEGQIPIYYDHFNTGRPARNDSDRYYTSSYLDLAVSPQYAFGHGLSYTSFEYGDLRLSQTALTGRDSIDVSFELKNTGKYAGEEVAQMYLRAQVSRPLRPVLELKGFQKIMLQPGESRRLHFIIRKADLGHYDDSLRWVTEPGEYQIMFGSASDDIRLRGKVDVLQ